MLPEQTPELTLANSEPCRQGVDIRFVETPRFDQPERAGYGIGTSAPKGELGRRFRPTAETRAKSRLLAPPPRWERSGRSLAWVWAPGKMVGNKRPSS